MIMPTPLAVIIFAAGVPIALILLVVNPDLWGLSFNYGLAVLIAIATDAMLAFPRRRLKVEAKLPTRLYIGESGIVRVKIVKSTHPRATRFEVLLEQRGALDPAEVARAEFAPGESARISLPVTPRRRGKVFVDAIWLRWRGPLSLVRCQQRVAIDGSVDVVPNVRGVQSAALQFFSQEAIYGIKVQQQRGEGSEFEALRDYVPGLDPRHVDWKHSARHRKLVCKEFQTERNHQIILAFDTGHLMQEPINGIARLDHAVNAALVLAWISLRSGDLVGLYSFDASVRGYRTPLRGLTSFGSIQRSTAELGYNSEETNFTLGLTELNVRLKRRALVVLFTEFIDTVTAELLIESLQRVANKHVVVFVTLRDNALQKSVDAEPHSFLGVAEAVVAGDFQREREIVLERLERLGLHCLDVPSGGLSVALINRYLLIKQRGLI
jgi:uncharacterized protein (DUF58 family)